jgi:farnesyl-diphosphate farnesyltransferase
MSKVPEIEIDLLPPEMAAAAAAPAAGSLAAPAAAAPGPIGLAAPAMATGVGRAPAREHVETVEIPASVESAETVENGETVENAASPAEISHLLEKTSRTFALAIPLLPEPTCHQVGIAYLLFRVADTFEDAELWPRAAKLEALERFAALLERPDREAARRETARWLAAPPCNDAGYLELLARVPAVLGAFWQLSEGPRRLIGEHSRRTAEGMARFVGRASEAGELQLADLNDLRGYCYVVAGIVGEMLTELFLLGRKALAPVRGFLRGRAARFGEALQLVNIVKDALADATHGRRFLPAESDPAEVIALARQDLKEAASYTLSLQRAGAPRGIVAFTALPIRLAQATLDLVEQRGPGAKLGRPDVSRIVEALDHALDEGLPAV